MPADKNSPSATRPATFLVKRPMVGVGVLVWRGKQLLLGERIIKDQKRCWQFPGGYLEAGESVIGCARREVLEETSVKVKDLRHLGFTDRAFDVVKRDVVKHEVITLLISCEYASGEALMLEPDKCAGWKWFDYDNLPIPLFDPTANFLSQMNLSPSADVQAAAVQEVTSVRGDSVQNDLYALHRAARVLADVPSDEHK